MRLLSRIIGSAIAATCLGVFLTGCSLTEQLQKNESPEAVVLDDGTTISCQILEINDQEVIIVPRNPGDSFQYGNKIPVSKIKWIRVMRDQQPAYLTIDEYLKLYSDQFETTPLVQNYAAEPEPGTAVDSAGNAEAKLTTPEASSAYEPGTPGLRISAAFFDSTQNRPRPSPIGLKLPERSSPPSLLPAPNYADLADFIIASGAAGLVLYRAEKFTEAGGKLSQSRYELINAIRSSDMWRERKAGLQVAHRIAALAFSKRYSYVQDEMKNELGFLANEKGDPFKQFMLFLKSHGSLYSKSQREKVQLWFGREAAQALFDIQANFDDWYYIAVISTRELEL